MKTVFWALVVLLGSVFTLQAQNFPVAKITSDGTCNTAPPDVPANGQPASLAVNSSQALCAGVTVSATIATNGLAISVNAGSSSNVGTPIYFRDTNGVFQPGQLDGAGVGNNLKVNCSNCSAAAGATLAAPGATVAGSGTTSSEASAINYIWNANTLLWDRVQGASVGDAATSTGLAATALFGFNGSTFDRLRSSNYGTSPGANPALGVNAFVTNTPAVTISGQPVTVNFQTSNIAENLVQLNGTTIATASYNGGAAAVVGFQTSNLAENITQFGTTNVIAASTGGLITTAGGIVETTQPSGLATNQYRALSMTAAAAVRVATGSDVFNVSVTNTPSVTITGTPVLVAIQTSDTVNVAVTGQPVTVNFQTANIAENITQLGGTAIATASYSGGAAVVVGFQTSNLAENITQFGSTNVIAAATGGLITTAGGVVETTQPSGLATNQYRAASMTAAAAIRVATGSDVFNVTPAANTLVAEGTAASMANGWPVAVGMSSGGTNTALVSDPCETSAGIFVTDSITTSTTIVTGTGGKLISLCSFDIYVNGTATNWALVEGTGTLCATNLAKYYMGGTTAATGPNFIANQGMVAGDGRHARATETRTADNICLVLSAANQVNYTIKYVLN